MRKLLILSVFNFLYCRLEAQTTATTTNPKVADTSSQRKMVNNIFQFAGTYFGLAENAGDFKEDRIISRKPAFMNITVPRNGDNSYLVNLALRFNITNLFDSAHLIRKVNIYPYLERQRNSLVDNQQNNFKYGMALNHRIYKLTNYRLMLETTMGANDSRNFITGVYAHQLSLYTGLAGNKETTSPARYFLPSSVMIPVDTVNLLKNVVRNADFLIGVDYIHGENPWLGLEFQDYWRFGFKLRM